MSHLFINIKHREAVFEVSLRQERFSVSEISASCDVSMTCSRTFFPLLVWHNTPSIAMSPSAAGQALIILRRSLTKTILDMFPLYTFYFLTISGLSMVGGDRFWTGRFTTTVVPVNTSFPPMFALKYCRVTWSEKNWIAPENGDVCDFSPNICRPSLAAWIPSLCLNFCFFRRILPFDEDLMRFNTYTH